MIETEKESFLLELSERANNCEAEVLSLIRSLMKIHLRCKSMVGTRRFNIEVKDTPMVFGTASLVVSKEIIYKIIDEFKEQGIQASIVNNIATIIW